MQINLCSEDVSALQHIYAEKPETVDWMLKFGSPLEMIMAGIIMIANEGKTGILSLGPSVESNLNCRKVFLAPFHK
jgi:hypothetical protein